MTAAAITSIRAYQVNPTPLLLKPLNYCGSTIIQFNNFIEDTPLPEIAQKVATAFFYALMLIPILISALIGVPASFSSLPERTITFDLEGIRNSADHGIIQEYLTNSYYPNDRPETISHIRGCLPRNLFHNDVEQAIPASEEGSASINPHCQVLMEIIPSRTTCYEQIRDRLLHTFANAHDSRYMGRFIVRALQGDVSSHYTQFIRTFNRLELTIFDPERITTTTPDGSTIRQRQRITIKLIRD